MFLLEAEMSVQTQVGFINKQKDISPPALCGELERLCLTWTEGTEGCVVWLLLKQFPES